MSVCCENCVLSGSGLCDGPISCPQYYRVWCVVVCDLETSTMERPRPSGIVETWGNKTPALYIKYDLSYNGYFNRSLIFIGSMVQRV